jgi:hypothetical protein
LRRLADATEEKIEGRKVGHTVLHEVDMAALDALGWARKARAAAGRAARPGAGVDEVRAALTDAQCALDELRRNEPRKLREKELEVNLAGLCGPPKRGRTADQDWLAKWSEKTAPRVRSVCAALWAADEAMAACWRELASKSAGRVRVKTVTVVE